MIVWLVVASWCFPGRFARYRHFELKIDVLPSQTTVRVMCVNLVHVFKLFIIPREIVTSYYVDFACTREHSIIERTHNSLSSLKILKMTLPTNGGTSEGPENLALLSVWGETIILVWAKIKACKSPRNDLKVVRVIDMTFLYDARHSGVLPRQKMRLNPWPEVQQSGFVWGNGLYQPGFF